jgi:hypothetical protein
MSWLDPFSRNAPRFPNRKERLAKARKRAGAVTGALMKRWALYRKAGIPVPHTGRKARQPLKPPTPLIPALAPAIPTTPPGASTPQQ